MPVLPPSQLHHLRVTVTDLERSLDFYTRIFGFEVITRSDGDPSDPEVRNDPMRLFGGVVLSANGVWFGLRPAPAAGTTFDSEHVGLDHLSFAVPTRQDLVDARMALQAEGVPHGEIMDLTPFGIAIMSVDDPDGIHLELTAPL